MSTAMTTPSPILCFIDVMCGYCYLAEPRLVQLRAELGEQIQLSYHFFSVFGDVRRRLDRSGKTDRAYGTMVHDTLARYDQVEVHPDVFQRQPPTSSVPAHLYLRAVKLLQDDGVLEVGDGPSPFDRLLRAVQLAFFRDVKDISQRHVLDDLLERLDIPRAQVTRVIDDGRAFAELAHDAALQRMHNVAATPSLVLDDGRLLSIGTMDYQVIEASISELLSARYAHSEP